MLIGEILERSAAAAPHRTAVVCGTTRLTFSELDQAANRVARALARRGIRPGDRVGLSMKNGWEYAAAYFGVAKAGAVSVHLPARFTPQERSYALSKIPVALQIDDGSFAELAAEKADSLPGLGLADDAPAAILFTSGTTGYPKGAVQPHGGRYRSAQAAQLDFGLTPEDVVAVASPMYHAAGLFTWFQTAMFAGASAVILPAWDPVEFMHEVAARGITGVLAVPTQLSMLLRHPKFDPALLASLRLVVYGGAPADPPQIAALAEALPRARLVQNYGSTEMGPVFCLLPEDRSRAPGALGRPNPLIEVEVFSAPGKPAAPGEVGELASRGPHLMLGYFGDEAATREFFRTGDGWGWTGDMASRDESGLITLVGRRNDTIISGALKTYPVEIERVLAEHPAVADCAAFGVKDEVWGQLPAAAVVLKPGASASREELLQWCEARIARHKRPRQVVYLEKLPYSPSGKLLRSKLAVS